MGIYTGIHFSDFVANFLHDSFGMTSEYVPVIAFTITFLGVGAGVYFAGKALERVVSMVALSPINKLFGLIFGLTKMLFLLSALLVIIESYDEKDEFLPDDLKEESLLYRPISKLSLVTIPALKYSRLFNQVAQ